jgi:hypothetical protein
MNFHGVKTLHTHKFDNPAVTMVLNVIIKGNARHFVPYLSFYYLLGKPLSLLYQDPRIGTKFAKPR